MPVRFTEEDVAVGEDATTPTRESLQNRSSILWGGREAFPGLTESSHLTNGSNAAGLTPEEKTLPLLINLFLQSLKTVNL